MYRYVLDKKTGVRTEIGYKSYRPKSGQLGKTNNTFQYSKQMQNCFKGKK